MLYFCCVIGRPWHFSQSHHSQRQFVNIRMRNWWRLSRGKASLVTTSVNFLWFVFLFQNKVDWYGVWISFIWTWEIEIYFRSGNFSVQGELFAPDLRRSELSRCSIFVDWNSWPFSRSKWTDTVVQYQPRDTVVTSQEGNVFSWMQIKGKVRKSIPNCSFRRSHWEVRYFHAEKTTQVKRCIKLIRFSVCLLVRCRKFRAKFRITVY